MTNDMKWGVWLTGATCLSALLLGVVIRRVVERQWYDVPIMKETIHRPVEAIPLPAPPPCIHENCFERPAFLNCISLYSSYSICGQWQISYEHHCDCDRWAAP